MNTELFMRRLTWVATAHCHIKLKSSQQVCGCSHPSRWKNFSRGTDWRRIFVHHCSSFYPLEMLVPKQTSEFLKLSNYKQAPFDDRGNKA